MISWDAIWKISYHCLSLEKKKMFSRRTCILKPKFMFIISFFCSKVHNAAHALPATKIELYVYASIAFIVVLWCRMRWQYRQFYRLADTIKGPPTYPLKGSIFDLRTTPESKHSSGETQMVSGLHIMVFQLFVFLWCLYLFFRRDFVQFQRYGREIQLWTGKIVGRPISFRRSL